MLFADLCTVCEIDKKVLLYHLHEKPKTIVENKHWIRFEKLVKNSKISPNNLDQISYFRQDSILIKFMDGINLLFQQLSENSSKNPAVNEIITNIRELENE